MEVATGTRDSRALLAVASTGPAVPAAAINRLFQPFQRLAADRTSRPDGLGLGLSIVQAIADAHHATITARPRPEGGLFIEVSFPGPPNGSPVSYAPGNLCAKSTAAALPPSTATERADRHPGSWLMNTGIRAHSQQGVGCRAGWPPLPRTSPVG